MTAASLSPTMQSSNPARIRQSIGGVGHNVALAAHKIGSAVTVKLCSRVANDIAGLALMSTMQAAGMDVSHVESIQHEDNHPGTAQYVAVNDAQKGLVVAMADMDILTTNFDAKHWRTTVQESRPKWLVLDANWHSNQLQAWIEIGRESGAQLAFEPVSVAKSRRLFIKLGNKVAARLIPKPMVDVATPNQDELAAMHAAARENGYFEGMDWFQIIDSFGIPSSGARDRFVRLASSELADLGVPVQAVQLLPYIPIIVTKLGAKGVLLTMILGKNDARLYDRDMEQYILSRSDNDHPHVGGIFMRLYPPTEMLDSIVSVNGAGDTMLGAIVAGMAQGGQIDRLIDVAQKAARMTLASRDAVSPKLDSMRQELLACCTK